MDLVGIIVLLMLCSNVFDTIKDYQIYELELITRSAIYMCVCVCMGVGLMLKCIFISVGQLKIAALCWKCIEITPICTKITQLIQLNVVSLINVPCKSICHWVAYF